MAAMSLVQMPVVQDVSIVNIKNVILQDVVVIYMYTVVESMMEYVIVVMAAMNGWEPNVKIIVYRTDRNKLNTGFCYKTNNN